MNKRYDTFDLLLEVLGYSSGENIKQSYLEENMEAISILADKIGVDLGNLQVDLELKNDDENDMMFVVLAISEICDIGTEKAMSIMLEAHESGSSVILTGNYKRLEIMKDQLTERNLSSSIRRVAKS